MRIAVSKGHNVYYKHGNRYVFDPGATRNPYTEADITNNTVNILIPLLKAKGHTVFDVTPLNQKFNDKKSAHEARSNKIKSLDIDLYLDVHMNAGGGTGPETWVYSTKSKAYDPARAIVNSLEKATGLRNRGVKVKKGFWSLSLHEAPSIIIEGAFMDSPGGQDLKVLTPHVYAKAIADAFEDISKPEALKPEKSKVYYRVRKDWSKPDTQKGAFSDLNNAIERVKELGSDYKVFDHVGKQVYPKVNTSPYDVHFESLNDKGIVVHEKRYDDFMTRGEVMALLDRATDIKKVDEVEKGEDMKTKAYKKDDAYIIETTPDNIKIGVVGGDLKSKNIYGMNGTFFDTSTASVTSPNSCVFIAVNDGKAISGNASLNGWNGPPRGTIYFNGKLGNKKVKNTKELPSDVIWAIGGYTVKPYIDVNEKIPGSINYATSHSYIGYDDKGKVYLVARTDKHRMHQIVPLLNELGITHCIMLDGGGSTQIRHKDISFHQARSINTAIILKEL